MTCDYLHESGYTEDYDGAYYAVLYSTRQRENSIVFPTGRMTNDVSGETWDEMKKLFGPYKTTRWLVVNDWFIENHVNGMGFLFQNEEDFLTFKLKWL